MNDPERTDEVENTFTEAEKREFDRRRRLWKAYDQIMRSAAYEEGRAEAREKGRTEEKTKDIIRLLPRFQGNVPESLAEKILEIRICSYLINCSNLLVVVFRWRSLKKTFRDNVQI